MNVWVVFDGCEPDSEVIDCADDVESCVRVVQSTLCLQKLEEITVEFGGQEQDAIQWQPEWLVVTALVRQGPTSRESDYVGKWRAERHSVVS